MAEHEANDGDNELKFRRRRLTYEVLALCGIQIPLILGGLVGFGGSLWEYLRTKGALYSVATEISRLGLYLFVMTASGDRLSSFGLKRIRFQREVWSFVLAALGLALISGGGYAIWPHGVNRPTYSTDDIAYLAKDLAPLGLLGLNFVVVGVVEEVLFRGYLITRLEELFGSTWKAVIVSASLFGLLHVYQGAAGVVHAFLIGLVFGAIFAKSRSIWPLALAHGIGDFVIVYFDLISIGLG